MGRKCLQKIYWMRDLLGGSVVKYPSVWAWFLGWKDPLEKEMTTYSSSFAWEIPWTEEPGGLQSLGSESQISLSNWALSVIMMLSIFSCSCWSLYIFLGWLSGPVLCSLLNWLFDFCYWVLHSISRTHTHTHTHTHTRTHTHTHTHTHQILILHHIYNLQVSPVRWRYLLLGWFCWYW